ncbi:MAG: molybdenum ABC transporter ATP-binding protein [Nitrospirales bacterium]
MNHQLVANFDLAFPGFHLHVNIAVPAEGIIAVFGPSGCGKTTLLRCLAGLERSPTGSMALHHHIWQNENQHIFVPLSERPIGYVFQEPRLFPHLNVLTNLQYGWKRTPESGRRITLDQVVQVLDMERLLDRRPSSLSGGEQQRIAIGRALLTSPQLLLMDEPLSSLDLPRKREILPFIQRLDAEFRIPIVYVTHDLHEIVKLAKTMVLLKEGKVAGNGPIEEVFSQLNLRHLIPENHLGALVETTVAEQDQEFRLTKLAFSGGHLHVPHQHRQIGERLRVQILAKDVSIISSPPSFQTSVLNLLEATVVEIGEVNVEHPFVDIKLDIGCPLLATITRKSLATLKLHPGQRVHAQIKTVALSHEALDSVAVE